MAIPMILVDDNDQEIGQKLKRDRVVSDIYRVSALWIKNSRGESLLARRGFNKRTDPGLWGPAVAGTVEIGETFDSNIIKEAEEELGLKNITPIRTEKYRVSLPHDNHFTQWYTLTLDQPAKDFIIKKDEVEEVKWFGKAELQDAVNKTPQEFLPNIKKWVKIFA